MVALNRLSMNTVCQSFPVIRNRSPNMMPAIAKMSEAIPQRYVSTSKDENPATNNDMLKKGASPNVDEESAAYRKPFIVVFCIFFLKIKLHTGTYLFHRLFVPHNDLQN